MIALKQENTNHEPWWKAIAAIITALAVLITAIATLWPVITNNQVGEYKFISTPSLSPIPTTPSIIVDIPLSGGWKADEEEGGAVGTEYKNGTLELKTRLQGENNYAKFYLDLRGVYLPEIERNPDGTYNLTGTELIAVVKSNHNFEGRLAFYNKSWDFLKGPWLDRIDATNGQMFFRVPYDISYSNINTICFVFAIQPNETYEGSFFVQSVILKK